MLRSTLLLATLGSVVLLGCPPAPKPPEAPPPAPQIVAFSASPEVVKTGEQVTLSWDTKNATKVELNQVGKGLVSGATSLTQSLPLNVDADSLFVLTATNDRGVRATAAAWVQVDDGVSEVIFVANPSKVRAGDPVVLAWNAQGAKEVSLAPKGGANLDLGGQLASGSVTVHPTAETTYVLTVDGNALETAVAVLPSIDVFTVSPKTATPGQPLTVAWKTSAAKSVTLSVSSAGELVKETEASRVADGTYEYVVPAGLNPAPVYTFTLLAEGATPEDLEKQHVEVYLAGKPNVITWDVPVYALTGNSFMVNWETSGADEVQILSDGVVVHREVVLGEVDEGSLELPTPAADTKLEIRAVNHRGGEDSEEKTVSPVGLPSLMDFTAAPQPGIATGGEKVTLSWNVPNARNLTISVNGRRFHTVSGPAAEMGSVAAYPNNDTTYVLTADNGVATSIAPESRSVTVTSPARLVFSPNNVPAGSTIQITGTTAAGTPVGYLAQDLVRKNFPGDAWIDIASTGAALPFSSSADTASQLITLSQPFFTNFGGVPVGGQKISVSVNGWMVFSDTVVTGSGVPDESFPSDDYQPQAIAVFGSDLELDATSKVYWQDDGTGDQRRIIVQWENVRICCVATKRITVQAQLYASGEVVLAYRAITGLANTDKGAIGVVNSDDNTAVGPSSDLLDSNGRPSPGDSFRLFGAVTLPIPVTASSRPMKIVADMGDGQLSIEDAPTIIPAGQFVISEVNYNPVAGADQWFEVLNTTSSAIDLAGWVLDFGGGVTHTISSTGGTTLLPANGRLLFGQTANAAEGTVTVDYVYGTTSMMNTTSGSMSIGLSGGIYTSLSWTNAGRPGASLQIGVPRTDLLYSSTPVELNCAGRQPYGTNGQLGTPGTANGICFWELTSIPGAFTSIATTGMAITGLTSTGNNSIDSVSRTVDFTANSGRAVRIGQNTYGDATNPLRVDSNGYITLSSTTNTGSNNSTPSTSGPNGTLAIYWDDLAGNAPSTGASGVYWQQFDPDPLASGDEYTLVSWENWKAFRSAGSLNFQIKILEATGDVEYHYGTMTSTDTKSANGDEATVWLESLDGTIALPVSINDPNIQPNTGYRFTAL